MVKMTSGGLNLASGWRRRDFMCDMIVVVRWADLTFSETTDVLEFSHTVI